MISLKRYLDQPSKDAEPVPPPDTAAVTLAYQSALYEFGQAGACICPPLGEGLQHALNAAADRLKLPTAGALVAEVHSSVHATIEGWTRETNAHFRTKAQEVKDILLTLSRVAESVGERDTLCAEQMQAVTGHLQSIADLEDLTEIRTQVVNSAQQLKAAVDRMTTSGKETMDALRAEVSTYRDRLEATEQLVARDSLTGLTARLAAEDQLHHRIDQKSAFCVALLDINAFKLVNDRHGHLAGDELLRQFSHELRGAFRPTDVVSRWGGDEFVIVMDCPLEEALGRAARLQQWVFGNYTLPVQKSSVVVPVTAAVGVAEFLPGETLEQLLDRADRAMYREKAGVHADPAAGRAGVTER